jgi:hypothetical protein
MYSYPAPLRPDATIACACRTTIAESTVFEKLFQDDQPNGGRGIGAGVWAGNRCIAHQTVSKAKIPTYLCKRCSKWTMITLDSATPRSLRTLKALRIASSIYGGESLTSHYSREYKLWNQMKSNNFEIIRVISKQRRPFGAAARLPAMLAAMSFCF